MINHGVGEGLMKEMVEICREFFDLTEEEKRVYETKHVLDPIRYGTSFNPKMEEVFFWRDYLKVLVHPKFHSPPKPTRFRFVVFFLFSKKSSFHVQQDSGMLVWDLTSFGEKNKAFFYKGVKILFNKRVLKPWGWSRQYLLTVGLSCYKWYQSQDTEWCVSEDAGPLKGVDCEIPH